MAKKQNKDVSDVHESRSTAAAGKPVSGRPIGGAQGKPKLFPKLVTVSEFGLRARYEWLHLADNPVGSKPSQAEIAKRINEDWARLGQAGFIAAIREAGANLVGLYVPGETICLQCAGRVHVASSPRGPVRYHTACPTCGESIQTEKLPKPVAVKRR